MLLPLCLSLLLVATVVRFVWHGRHWRRLGLEGPFGWPLVGNMLNFALARQSYGEVYEWIYRTNPGLKYVGFYRLFNEPALLVRDQDLLRQILVGTNFADCADNVAYVDHRRDVLASHNPFIASGDRWRIFRADLVPLFTPLRVRQMLPHVDSACRLLRDQVSVGCFEAKELSTRYTLQVIASVVFGLDAHCLGGQQKSEQPSRWLEWLAPLFQPNGWSLLETIALLHSPRLGRLIGHRSLIDTYPLAYSIGSGNWWQPEVQAVTTCFSGWRRARGVWHRTSWPDRPPRFCWRAMRPRPCSWPSPFTNWPLIRMYKDICTWNWMGWAKATTEICWDNRPWANFAILKRPSWRHCVFIRPCRPCRSAAPNHLPCLRRNLVAVANSRWIWVPFWFCPFKLFI
ncbi:probable cytochrome P450 308a1 isoform X3 [Drosophila gunungcola]|nr:probable cytochrome P450 308a1 isoform X3 [Drosophila gunungcola]